MKVVRKEGEGAKRLAVFLKALETINVEKVGWLKDSKYPADEKGQVKSVAEVAVTNEYGVPGRIPARPTMRPAIIKNKIRWQTIAKQAAVKMLDGELTVDQALDQVGLAAAGDIRKEITELVSPPLAQATIDARTQRYANTSKTASDKPLVDTGLMVTTLTNTLAERGK